MAEHSPCKRKVASSNLASGSNNNTTMQESPIFRAYSVEELIEYNKKHQGYAFDGTQTLTPIEKITECVNNFPTIYL